MQDSSTWPLYALFSRLFWMMAGPMLLGFLTWQIVTASSGWLTALDLAFFVVLGGMVLSRLAEYLSGRGQTVYGERATRSHVSRYAAVVAIGGLSVWLVANLVGNHVL
jgi:hypothetical protein